MGGVAVVVNQVRPDAVLLCSSSCLPQSQVADLSISLGRLQPPFAEPPFETGRLELLIEEVDLTAERLALLVHHPVPVDFGHEAPIMNGEFIELTAKGGEGGSAPTAGGNDPCGQGSRGAFIAVV